MPLVSSKRSGGKRCELVAALISSETRSAFSDNEAMTEKMEIAIEFVDELLKLGVLEESPDNEPVLAKARCLS